jgi:hypothetical protein
MNFLQILQDALKNLASSVVAAVLPVIISWVQKHLGGSMQALPKEQLRAQTRTWVKDLLSEMGNALVSKGLVPLLLQPLLSPIEGLIEQEIDKALDAAGL